ncbi:outer membrane beta-barrel protein [Shewanella sp. D64]|uniref:outer membrane beta-barrel protein n=1 Tax=unclassified Shewanella TaxID=196818 RepID=UPI0022BA609B|nr:MULTISPECIES: outer membrane beta-barrel protein [unclassified Shewanella]MEC4728070.1 outer membrane beta-barrel protein [Shewanella sp. D64]MEC4738172.1 outer membrane beta-barrel protein [Shewanella sp. E94]WBJ96317.1 outer membrane beta-barrel protein [Shewanella sp. MTB7]
MKSMKNRSYCGSISPGRLALSVISIPNRPAQTPHCPAKPAKEKATFPLIWLCLLGCLLLCNSVMANDVSWKLRGYYLQQLADIDAEALGESTINRGLAFRVKGEANQFEIGYTSQSNWLVAFEQLTLGGQNALFTEVVSLDSELQDSFNQEVGQYSGWGVKLGYRYVLSDVLFGSLHLGGFNWELVSLNASDKQRLEQRGQNGTSPYVGFGIEYRISEQASWVLNWQHVELNSDSFDDLVVKLAYLF